MSSDESNELIIAFKKGAAVKTLLFTLLFAAGIYWVASTSYGNPHKSIKMYIFLAIVPVAIFGLLLLAYGAARILVKRLPAIVVDDRGLTSHSLNGSSDFHPWSEIGGFALREEQMQRNTMLFLEVLGKTPNAKPICTIHADDLPHRPKDILYTLEELAAKRASESGEDAPAIAAAPTPSPLRWNYTTIVTAGFAATLLLGVILVAIPLMKQTNYLMMAKEGGFELAQDFADIDAALSDSPISQALQEAEPKKFEQMRQELFDARRRGMGPDELGNQITTKTDAILQSHLQHASPRALCAYFRLHLGRLEEMAKESPGAMYTVLTGSYDIPSTEQEMSPEAQERYSRELAKIIAAPLAQTPLPQDDALVEARVKTIYQRLSPEELNFVTKVRKESLDFEQQEAYCKAYFHFYREVLKLPEAEAVQILRSLDILPQDDRAVAAIKS